MIPLMRTAFLNEQATREALARFILTTPRLSMDKTCLEFEQAFAAHEGRRDAVLFNSGGSANLALLQALKNLGLLADGDLVGFSALTWSTNTMPILQLGMRPVAVDIRANTLNVMSDNLEQTLKRHPLKAFFGTNVLGLTGDLDQVARLCEQHGILFLEDNCESLGTTLPSGRSGSFGKAATFSFYVAHHMSTIEGGMVVTDDPTLAEMLRIVRANGWDRNLTPQQQAVRRERFGLDDVAAAYAFYDLGYNLRPTEITGFLGIEQLKYVDASVDAREENFRYLETAVLANPDMVALRHDHINRLSSFSFPMIFTSPEKRAFYQKRFVDAHIEIRPIVAGNMQRQPFYQKYVKTLEELPQADLVHERGFYCGNYPELTRHDLDAIRHCLQP